MWVKVLAVLMAAGAVVGVGASLALPHAGSGRCGQCLMKPQTNRSAGETACPVAADADALAACTGGAGWAGPTPAKAANCPCCLE